MTKSFDRTLLLEAFDAIGTAAVENGVRLEMAVYGGAALMLAGNFRFSTEDVDIAELPRPWPLWLSGVCEGIANRNGWSEDWLNDAVTFHLSPAATRAADHLEFGTFPRGGGPPGLIILVPTSEYMLALKLEAMRLLDPVKGQIEADDIYSPMTLLKIRTPDQAIAVLARYFPNSAKDSDRQRFLLKHLAPSEMARTRDAPRYDP
ncbi:MAG TPA: hypothetical protein VH414_05550 [Lichenihabitans sp.]|nr:hypothetical protein [Lichenihabitans sp.]